MSEPDESPELAPDGSTCPLHPERAALVVCPRCGTYCCITCWQPTADRCHPCLLRDPGPPVPWADPERSPPGRFFGTFFDALRPRATATSFTRGSWRSGLSFAALTFLPLALLSGLIPFTHTLAFGPQWAVHAIGTGSLGLDLAQAAGLGLAISLMRLGLLGAAFVSLASAYGKKLESEPARQAILYRAWLLPFSGGAGLLPALFNWGSAPEPGETLVLLAAIASVVPMVLLFASLLATARQANGVGPFASFLVVFVPIIAMFAMEPLLFGLLEPLMPNAATLHQAAAAASP